MENSIKEDIARIVKLITTKFNNDYSIDNKDKEALEHILSDYKRVLKENEQLRTEVNSLKKENEGLKEYTAIAPNLDEMTAIKYRNIQKRLIYKVEQKNNKKQNK